MRRQFAEALQRGHRNASNRDGRYVTAWCAGLVVQWLQHVFDSRQRHTRSARILLQFRRARSPGRQWWEMPHLRYQRAQRIRAACFPVARRRQAAACRPRDPTNTAAASVISTVVRFLRFSGIPRSNLAFARRQNSPTGHSKHCGARGVQIVAPSSIMAWFQSPGDFAIEQLIRGLCCSFCQRPVHANRRVSRPVARERAPHCRRAPRASPRTRCSELPPQCSADSRQRERASLGLRKFSRRASLRSAAPRRCKLRARL